jgi:hypothetical protein
MANDATMSAQHANAVSLRTREITLPVSTSRAISMSRDR